MFVLGLGGTTTPGSSTEQALAVSMAAAQAAGAQIESFLGADLAALPHFARDSVAKSDTARRLVDAYRRADGIIIASPGYHGSISGLVKNALDYLEETARDDRVYLDGVPAGLIATAYGPQATVSTLVTLRTIVHALRGWPTPMGASINTLGAFKDGVCVDPGALRQLQLVGRQVTEFAAMRTAADAAVMATG